MTVINVADLQFYSGDPIDKIFTQGTLSLSVPKSSDGSTLGIATTAVANPYGQAGFTTVSFSLDNINFYNQNSSIEYWNSGLSETLSQMIVTSGCDASSIYFMATSLYTVSAQTVFINYAVDSAT